MDTRTVTGMVLASTPIGEYDRRLVILTRELGKISCFARGARRQNSSLLAAARPFVTGSFELYAGKNSYTLQRAEVQEYFSELSQDLEAMSYGCYFMELAEYYAAECQNEGEMLNLLYVTLKALQREGISNALVRIILELRMFLLEGEYPQVFQCQICQKEQPGASHFSIARGGLLCEDCQNRDPSAIALSAACVYTLQYSLSAPLGRLYTFQVSSEVLEELKHLMKRWRSRYLEREFQSLEILQQMETIQRGITGRMNPIEKQNGATCKSIEDIVK